MLFYKHDINKSKYNQVLDFMLRISNSFALVESFADYSEYEIYMSPTKRKLEAYCLNSELVTKWPGTELGRCVVTDEQHEAMRHYYKCCKESIDILREFDSFFSIENQMDIAFYKDSVCLLHTTSHEEFGATNSKYCYNIIRNKTH